MQEPDAAKPAPSNASGAPPTMVHLRGRIVSWDGKPIAGAAVALAPAKSMTTAELLAKPPQVTGADGSFDFTAPAEPPETREPAVLLVAAKGMASIARSPGWNYEKTKTATANPRKQRARDTDIKEVVLPEGARLVGRVRDADGKPLAGVMIAARDMLESHRVLQGPRFDSYCRARTDEQGIFQLANTLPNAVNIDVSMPGYYRQQLEAVAIDSPLEIRLQRSGTISGRVLDHEGRGVADATVSVNYERRGNSDVARTEADGSFRLNLDRPARYRLSTSKSISRTKSLSKTSEVLEGPRANLELQLPALEGTETDEAAEVLEVRAVRKRDEAPVTSFRYAFVFEEYANRNNNYLEYRLSERFAVWQDALDGKGSVPAPAQGNATTGVVRVTAPGFAPATKRDVEWKDVEAGKTREPLRIELVPEATIRGKVLDEVTGAPIAGAMVWAVLKPDANGGIYDPNNGDAPASAVRTGDDGSFAVAQLGEGTWQLRCNHPQRPRVPATDVELKAEEQKTGVDLKLPAGAVVQGRITGMPIPQGARVFLQELPRTQFGVGGGFVRYSSGGGVPDNAVALGSDGAFQFSGIKLESFMLLLVLPSPPRCGGTVVLPLEPFRVRKDGIQRDFAATEDQPGSITGKITFPVASIPTNRLVVIAQQVSEEQQLNFYPGMQFQGPRSFVGADGNFDVRVGPGTHRLILLDVATGVMLAMSSKDVRVGSGERSTADIAAALVTLQVKLVPEEKDKPCAVVDRVEVRHTLKSIGNQGGFAGENYEQCMSVDVAPGQTELTLTLPVGSGLLLARNNVATIRVDDQRNNVMPVGRMEVEIANTDTARIESELKIGPPSEIPDPKEKHDDETTEDGTEAKEKPATKPAAKPAVKPAPQKK